MSNYPIDSSDIEVIQSSQIFFNDKILILTSPKIAHSLCKNSFLGKQVDTTFYINTNTLEILDYKSSDNNEKKEVEIDYHNQVTTIWNNFLNKKEKRDFIILYRNPLEHFISAVMQERLNKFEKDGNFIPFFSYFIQSLPYSNYVKNNFMDEYLKDDRGISPYLLEKYPEICGNIIKITLDYFLSGSDLTGGHFTLWLSFIQKLIQSEKIDNHKMKFIDIYDAPLQKQLASYHTFPESALHENREFSYIHETIKKIIKDSPRLSSIVHNLIKYELIYYNEIKLGKKNKET